MEVFRERVDNIDFESHDPNDFRAKQLRDLSAAVATMLTCISKTDERDQVDASALAIAPNFSSRNQGM